MQARYGWTDEVVMSLSYKQYIRKLKIASDRYRQERNENSASAFSLAVISYYLTSPKMPIKKYMEMLGLKEIEPPKSKKELEKEAKEAVAKSKNIISMMNRK